MKSWMPRLRRVLGAARKVLQSRRRWVPLMALVLIALLAAGFPLLNCNCTPPPVDIAKPIPLPPGVPLIRVKLTRSPEPVLATTGAYTLYCDRRAVAACESAMPNVLVARAGRTWTVGNQSFAGDSLELRPSGNTLARYGPNFYRGILRLLPYGDGFTVVNCLDIENYLAGVLAKELYTTWANATYQALAVAARTFARYQSVTAGTQTFFDVTDDQASQVYAGFTGETPRSRSAVAATAGMMLRAGPPGQEALFLTQYSACCGGNVNGAGVLRNVPPLAPLAGGQACTDCAACSKYRWPPVRVTKSDAFAALRAAYPAAANLGQVAEVRVFQATAYGRPVWLDIVGLPGKDPLRIRADDLRLALLRLKNPAGVSPAAALFSMNCQIRGVQVPGGGDFIEFYDGKGFGHGVGLCQWGAQGKAQKGWTARQILDFYYPGAKIVKAY